ncbi:hypothetical protein KJ751_00570 [Patescibacteria group bacterium]|nr:hypothetical protein [Patescibacteria group bacterium]
MGNKRPWTITTICILGFIGAGISTFLIIFFPNIFETINADIGSWYSFYLACDTVAVLIAMVGLWMMKKWSIVLYAILVMITCMINAVTDFDAFVGGGFGWLAILLPVIVITVGFYNFKKMT